GVLGRAGFRRGAGTRRLDRLGRCRARRLRFGARDRRQRRMDRPADEPGSLRSLGLFGVAVAARSVRTRALNSDAQLVTPRTCAPARVTGRTSLVWLSFF